MSGGEHGQLKSIVERIERLEADKAVVANDIKEVYSEAKANGFDTKVLKAIITLRKMDPAERETLDSLIDTYMAAIGMSPVDDEEEE
jgi:uncharacterized protein (UPF0335 family)